MCPAYLIKTGSSNLQPRLLCHVKLTAAAMSKSAENTPSKNVPIICPACEHISANPEHLNQSTLMSTAKVKKNCVGVMKYNMLAHCNRVHSTSQTPAGLLRALELAHLTRRFCLELTKVSRYPHLI